MARLPSSAPSSLAPARSRSAYVTGIVGALLIAFSAILVRVSGATPSAAAVFRCAYALPFLGVIVAWDRRRYGPRAARDRWLAVGAGVFFAADLTIWHHAIGAVGAGLATVIANTQVVFVGLVAWVVLGERPSRRVLWAVPVILIGVVLISGLGGPGAYGERPIFGAVLGVLTAFVYTGSILLLRASNSDQRRPAGALFDATAVAALVAALAGLALGDLPLDFDWPTHGWLALLALNSQVVAWLLISFSLPRLPAVITSILLLLQPVGAVALGIVLLGEAPSALQLTGVGLVIGGILLATLRRPKRRGARREIDEPEVAHV